MRRYLRLIPPDMIPALRSERISARLLPFSAILAPALVIEDDAIRYVTGKQQLLLVDDVLNHQYGRAR